MLEVQNVYAGYHELNILKNISLRVKEKQLVSIVGGNGAGKSTLVRVISGLIRHNKGNILFQNKLINEVPPYIRVRQGIVQVAEGRELFPNFTVLENLAICRTHVNLNDAEFGIRQDLVFKLFPRLKERMKQIASTLSGGEQQMLAIARGLMLNPKIFILDEPSLGLAPLLIKEIFDTIKILKENGLTILLIEQNLKLSLALCDYGFVLENGQIVMTGTGRDLANDVKTKQAYLGI